MCAMSKFLRHNAKKNFTKKIYTKKSAHTGFINKIWNKL